MGAEDDPIVAVKNKLYEKFNKIMQENKYSGIAYSALRQAFSNEITIAEALARSKYAKDKKELKGFIINLDMSVEDLEKVRQGALEVDKYLNKMEQIFFSKSEDQGVYKEEAAAATQVLKEKLVIIGAIGMTCFHPIVGGFNLVHTIYNNPVGMLQDENDRINARQFATYMASNDQYNGADGYNNFKNGFLEMDNKNPSYSTVKKRAFFNTYGRKYLDLKEMNYQTGEVDETSAQKVYQDFYHKQVRQRRAEFVKVRAELSKMREMLPKLMEALEKTPEDHEEEIAEEIESHMNAWLSRINNLYKKMKLDFFNDLKEPVKDEKDLDKRAKLEKKAIAQIKILESLLKQLKERIAEITQTIQKDAYKSYRYRDFTPKAHYLEGNSQIVNYINRLDNLLGKLNLGSFKPPHFAYEYDGGESYLLEITAKEAEYEERKGQVKKYLKTVSRYVSDSKLTAILKKADAIKYVNYIFYDREIKKLKEQMKSVYLNHIDDLSGKKIIANSLIKSDSAIVAIFDKSKEKLGLYNNTLNSLSSLASDIKKEVQSFRNMLDNSSKYPSFHDAGYEIEKGLSSIFSKASNVYAFGQRSFPYKSDYISYFADIISRGASSSFQNKVRDRLNAQVFPILSKFNPRNNRFSLIVQQDFLRGFNYPLYENRDLKMTQAEVDAKRKEFMKQVDKTIDIAKAERSSANKLISEWPAAKIKIVSLYTNEIKKDPNLYFTLPSFKRNDEFIAQVKVNIKNYSSSLVEYNSRTSKAKTRRRKVDKAENDRILFEDSKVRMQELKSIYESVKNIHNDFINADKYFPIYLELNIGQAKLTYLFLFNRLTLLDELNERAESNYILGYHKDFSKQASDMIAKIADYYIEIYAKKAYFRTELSSKIINVDELEDNADKLDTSGVNIYDILYGNTDSDNDGIPDSVELKLGTDPIADSTVSIIHSTATITSGQYLDMASGAVLVGSLMGIGELAVMTIGFDCFHGPDFLNLATFPTMPLHSTWGGSVEYMPAISTVGNRYALTWAASYSVYAIIDLLSSSGSTVTIEYWYKPDGGTFSL